MSIYPKNMDELDRFLMEAGVSITADIAPAFLSISPDPETMERLKMLDEKFKNKTLSDDERADHESLVEAARFASLLEIKARAVLSEDMQR